jgi:hypothetical protein
MVEAPMTAAVLGVEKAAMAAAVMGVEKAGRGDQNPSPTQKLYFVKAVSMAPFWWMNNFINPPHQKKDLLLPLSTSRQPRASTRA